MLFRKPNAKAKPFGLTTYVGARNRLLVLLFAMQHILRLLLPGTHALS